MESKTARIAYIGIIGYVVVAGLTALAFGGMITNVFAFLIMYISAILSYL